MHILHKNVVFERFNFFPQNERNILFLYAIRLRQYILSYIGNDIKRKSNNICQNAIIIANIG